MRRSIPIREGYMKFLLFFYLFSISPCSFADINISSDNTSRIYEITISGIEQTFKTKQGLDLVQVHLKDISSFKGVLYKEGLPELPALRIPVLGDGEISIEQVGSRIEEKLIGHHSKIIPNLESTPRSHTSIHALAFNEAVYNSQVYPESISRIDKLGSVRGENYRLVSLFPVQYHPQNETLTIQTKWIVRVKSSAATEKTRYAEPEGILLVVGERFSQSQALLRFKEHKESLGYFVHSLIVSLKEKDPNNIRKQIQQKYRNAPFIRHIIILGDNEDIPGAPAPGINGVTDHLYRAIDVDDYEQDVATPDTTLGRFSFDTESEFSSYVDRIITYETGRFTHPNWLNRASLISTDDFQHYKESEATQTALESLLKDFWKITSDLLFGITFESKGEDVINKINEGRGLISYAGHGEEDKWVGPAVTSAMLDQVQNTEAIPLVLSHACYTGHFVGNSFAESWLRKSNGAIAFWGSMDVDFWGEGDIFERIINSKLFATPTHNLGEALLLSTSEFWNQFGGEGHSRYFWEDYILFGDPTLSYRTQEPRPVRLITTDITPISSDLSVTFSFQMFPLSGRIEGTRVALISPDGHYRHLGYLDNNGRVTFFIPNESLIKGWQLVVSGANTPLSRFSL